jgi:MFS family permease
VVAILASGLPRSVYFLQAGLVVNAFGNGAANPFLVLYLHDARGVPLAVAGLASATGAVCAVSATLAGGTLGDRVGMRTTLVGGLMVSATAFALYPLVREPWQAFVPAALSGLGAGSWLTMQGALVAALTPQAQRPAAFAQQRVAANVGLGLGAFVGGVIVTTSDPRTFTALFALNAATFVTYAAVLMRLPASDAGPPSAQPAPYRELVRDGALVRVVALNFVFVAAAVSLLNGLFPVYARNDGGISETAIGLLFLLNSLLIVALQVPAARALSGYRRMPTLAAMGALFAACWLLTLAGGGADAAILFAAAMVVMSLGECLYDVVVGPLVADLARGRALSRTVALSGFSWQLGFILGPAVGGALLGAEPPALWIGAAAVCLLAGLWALRVEATLPPDVRVTP